MAKNYSVADAFHILFEGKDVEAIADMGRRHPLFLYEATKLIGVAGDKVFGFTDFIPDYVTVSKVFKLMRLGTPATSPAEEDVEDEVESEEETQPEEEEPEPEQKPKRGRRKKEPEPEHKVEEESEGDGKYAGKNAVELFKECKKRGIKAEPKKPAKYYIELLEGADDAEDDGDDDWDI